MTQPEAVVSEAQQYDDTILQVVDLRTYFHLEDVTVRAVDGVSFSLGRQKTLGIVGESGCGKSITAMSIMRLLKEPPGKIEGGQIYLYPADGTEAVDIVALDPKGPEMRRIRGGEIAMIFQEPMTSLNPLYSVGRQIAESVEIHEGLSRDAAMARALEMLKKVQIADAERRLNEYPHQLSGGMRQRVMIALALSCNPSILIADEPTTALDVTVQAQILELMAELQSDFNSSIILITHNLGVVSQMADHVAVMYLGKIVEYGETHDIFHNPLHPYTVGLLNSVPVLGRAKRELVPIKGMVPSPTEEIGGCAFATRCPRVMRRCIEQQPVLREIRPDHTASCWLYD
jgi:peptide/nickel transport system ATP-binding protein/oligopeptide transport system ATP-binding protein